MQTPARKETLREIMGLRPSVEIDGKKVGVGETVIAKKGGKAGTIKAIGRNGLVLVDGLLGVYAPDQLKVDKLWAQKEG